MQPIDFVRSKIKACGVRTAAIVSQCERLDKNRDGIVHFDDIDYILANLMGKKNQLSRREARHLMLALSNSQERGEVIYKNLYDVLDAKTKDNGENEIWRDNNNNNINNGEFDSTFSGVRFSKRSIKSTGSISRGGQARVGHELDPAVDGIPGATRKTYVPRGSLGDWLHKKASPGEMKNFRTFVHALERYERDSGMRVQDSRNGFILPLGPDLQVSIEFRTT